MGTETTYRRVLHLCRLWVVKLNDPLMGTETISGILSPYLV